MVNEKIVKHERDKIVWVRLINRRVIDIQSKNEGMNCVEEDNAKITLDKFDLQIDEVYNLFLGMVLEDGQSNISLHSESLVFYTSFLLDSLRCINGEQSLLDLLLNGGGVKTAEEDAKFKEFCKVSGGQGIDSSTREHCKRQHGSKLGLFQNCVCSRSRIMGESHTFVVFVGLSVTGSIMVVWYNLLFITKVDN
jgi:hypothetical protein